MRARLSAGWRRQAGAWQRQRLQRGAPGAGVRACGGGRRGGGGWGAAGASGGGAGGGASGVGWTPEAGGAPGVLWEAVCPAASFLRAGGEIGRASCRERV